MVVNRNFEKIYKNRKDPWDVGSAETSYYNETLQIIRDLKYSPRRILDLGCGNGIFTNRIKEYFPNADIVGVDISQDAITCAQKNYSNIKFISHDIREFSSLQLDFNEFDIILLLDILYYFEPKELRQILKNVQKLLKIKGYLVVRSWTPGGEYLTHRETRSLLDEFFLYKNEKKNRLTQHSFFLYRNECTPFIFTIDYETWQPLPPDKKIDWNVDVFDPTVKLLDFAESVKIKLTFMVDMGEYYWLKENRSEIANQMENQLKEIIQKGHDIQLHIHPSWLPECGANFDEIRKIWFWNAKYQKIHNYPGDLTELFLRCKNDLEKLLKPIDPSYEAIVFRACQYQLQPSQKIINSLFSAGLIADTSVWKGGVNHTHGFDFRNAYTYTQPYMANTYNANYLTPSGEKKILEFPIFSFQEKRLMFDEVRDGNTLIKIIKDYKKSKITNLMRYRFSINKTIVFRIVSLFISNHELSKINFFIDNLWEKIIFMPKYNSEIAECIVTTCHTKQQLYFNEIKKTLNFLKVEFPNIKPVIMRTIAREIYNKNTEKSLYNIDTYQKYIKNQIEYNYNSIIGDKRTWQQSFYAQKKIPLDRKKILDIGCGTGYWTKRLNDKICTTIGVDIGDDFITKAKNNYPELEFYKMDFHNLNFIDESFDCVYGDNILEHSPFPNAALKEIYRVLSQKGFFLALIPPDARNPMVSGKDHIWKTDKDDVKIRLEEIGFVNIHIEDLNTRKLGMSQYEPSYNSMLIITAWKYTGGGYTKLERVTNLMQWCYNTFNPEKNHIGHYEFIRKIIDGYAWCEKYASVMQYVCDHEGFKTRRWTLYRRDHPRGRGPNKIDTHEVLEVFIDGNWVLCDPTTNLMFGESLESILKNPKMADIVIAATPRDERWIQRRYDLYASSWFYKDVWKAEKHTSVYVFRKKIYYYFKEKLRLF